MMKKTCTLFMLLLMASSISAKQITQNEAKQRASAFLIQQGKTIQNNLTLKAKGLRKANSQDAAYYVFNAADNNGFVIVSGDDRTDAILGYSTQGAYDADKMPPAMKAWLDDYAHQISMMDQQNTTAATYAVNKVKMHTAIAPLLKTKWDQVSPYNDLCPTAPDGQKCHTGCVATALAQVMAYHQWPQDYTDTIPEYSLSTGTSGFDMQLPALPKVKFNWGKMPLPQGDADNSVATLMEYCGHAVHMEYSTNVSNAGLSLTPYALKYYFGYDQNLTCAIRNTYTVNEWDSIMYRELEESRPVMYGGSAMGGGHAFVVDGYNGNGLYHVNWGWSGASDGFFRLSVLNPYNNSGSGASSSENGYNYLCAAYIGVQKPTGQELKPANARCASISRNANDSIFAEYESAELNKKLNPNYFGWGTMNSDGTIKVITSSQKPRICLTMDETKKTIDTLDLKALQLAPGSYNLVPISHSIATTVWSRASAANMYVNVNVDNAGKISSTVYPVFGLKVDSLCDRSHKMVGETQRLLAKVHSDISEFNGTLYLFVSKTDSLGSQQDYCGTAVEAQTSDSAELYFLPKEIGTYHLYIATDENGQNIIYTDTIAIGLPEVSSLSGSITTDDICNYTMPVKNNSKLVEYCGDIYMNVGQYNEATSAYDYNLFYSIRNVNIKPGSTSDYNFDMSNDIKTPGKYRFQVNCNNYSYIFDSEHVNFLTQDIEITTTGIKSVSTGNSNARPSYFTLQGTAKENPTQKGLYIRNGKLVIIK